MKKNGKTLRKLPVEPGGIDVSISHLLALVAATLKKAGRGNDAREMEDRGESSASFDEALSVICQYVELIENR